MLKPDVDGRTLIQADSRGRVTLPGKPGKRRYLVTEQPDGSLLLIPAVVEAEHPAHRDYARRIQTVDLP